MHLGWICELAKEKREETENLEANEHGGRNNQMNSVVLIVHMQVIGSIGIFFVKSTNGSSKGNHETREYKETGP